MSNLLIEQTDVNLTESKITGDDATGKKYVIEGIFLQSNIKNGNGRVYPEQVMDNAVNRYIVEYLNNNRAVGELEHPEEGRTQQIVLRFVSHKITELKKQGTNWWGRAEITKNTDMGRIVVGLMEAGITLGTSSRATGSLRNGVVQNDFKLITPSDIVFDPSAPDALVQNIMENKIWMFNDNDELVERQLNAFQKQINTDVRNKVFDANAKNDLFESILNLAKNKGV
jgi:hypothetical protein